MSEAVGRAGFNVRHIKHGQGGTRSQRASILWESMRELNEKAASYYAKDNPNIVAADTALNVAMVNDGAGGFRPARSTKEVLDYGDTRIGTKANEKGEDRIGNTGPKWLAHSSETTLIVAALPRSMCIEIPEFYEVRTKEGKPVLNKDGEQLMRSRWVARDRDEALQYFRDTVEFLGERVFTGGQAAIHGYDVNFDEGYPHIQLMADTLAVNPKDGELRCETSRMWGSHREVRDANDRQLSGPAKMRSYQADYREAMRGLGYDVELDASERSMSSHTREEWAELQERERVAEATAEVLDRQQVKLDASLAVAKRDMELAYKGRRAAEESQKRNEAAESADALQRAADARLRADQLADGQEAIKRLRIAQGATEAALRGLDEATDEYREANEVWLAYMDSKAKPDRPTLSMMRENFMATRPDLASNEFEARKPAANSPKRGLSARERALRSLRDSQSAEEAAQQQGLGFGD